MPNVPFENVLHFMHGGRESHFYGCNTASYIKYPYNRDDIPLPDLLALNDHIGYYCVIGLHASDNI